MSEFFAQDGVHALDLVPDDLLGGVPDAELLAQLGIEGLQERLVEVLHGVPLVEGLEELPRDPRGSVRRRSSRGPRSGPAAQTVGIGDLHEQRAEHRHAQEPVGQSASQMVRSPGRARKSLASRQRKRSSPAGRASRRRAQSTQAEKTP